MVWFEHEHFVAGDENLVAILLEEWSPTQPCGSASVLENQMQGAAGQSDGFLTTGDHGVLARTSQSQRPAASFFEGPTLTQPCGSGSDSENQLKGPDGQFESSEGAGFLPAPSSSRGFNNLNTHGFLATADHGAAPNETMNRGQTRRETKLANWASTDTPCFIEGSSPTQPWGNGSELENQLEGAAWEFESSENAVGLPGPSSSQGCDDLSSHGCLATALPQKTMKRRRETEQENGKRRHRGSNWSPVETTCFLKHMETVVAGRHKPPWRAVSESLTRDGYERSEKAAENRWGVLLAALKRDSISSSRGLPYEWRESMMRILNVRPRVCRKLRSATPAPSSPSSGNETEELSSLIAKKESINDEIIRVLRKELELYRKQRKPKTRKRMIRGGLGSGDDYDERSKP